VEGDTTEDLKTRKKGKAKIFPHINFSIGLYSCLITNRKDPK
jgi:hypothetical protein